MAYAKPQPRSKEESERLTDEGSREMSIKACMEIYSHVAVFPLVVPINFGVVAWSDFIGGHQRQAVCLTDRFQEFALSLLLHHPYLETCNLLSLLAVACTCIKRNSALG